MNTTTWKKIETVLLVLLLITTAGLGIYLITAVGQIRNRLGRLEDEVLDLAHPDGATRSAATRMKKMSADMADLTKRLEALDDRIGALLLKARANSKRLDSLEAGDLSDLGLGALIDRKLKGGAHGAAPFGPSAGRDIDSIGDKIQLTSHHQRDEQGERGCHERAHRGSTGGSRTGRVHRKRHEIGRGHQECRQPAPSQTL